MFSIEQTFFNLWDYPVSYIEFIASLAGVIAVYLAAHSNILTWPIGIVNITLFFIIFWQVQLYSDVFLQVYYFVISIYGWKNWNIEMHKKIPIKMLNNNWKLNIMAIILSGSICLGYLVSHFHTWWPNLFSQEAAFPYADSAVALMSIIANTLMAKRFLENWFLWIMVNIVCIFLYFAKNIIFVSIEYFVFLLLAIIGHIQWKKEIKITQSPY